MAFDPLVANSARLEILTTLAAEGHDGPVEFVRLRRHTRLTDGNLACHAKRLRAAGLICVDKQFRDGKPVTSYALTSAGELALREHVRRLTDAVAGPVRVPEPAPVYTHAVDAEDADEPWVD